MNSVKAFMADKRMTLALFALVAIVYGVSFYIRQASYSSWMQNRQDYVVENVTAMSGADSYYWLKMARELDQGTLGHGEKNPLKGYPDSALFAYKDTPSLLAKLISFGKAFTGGDYYRSGLLLIPLLAGLFVFPLFFYFNRLGYGASAVLGGLVGSFSKTYYSRTRMGRIDTDLLNTFFPILAACFILPISRERDWRANIVLAAGAGLTMNLFTRWYQQPSFILLMLASLAAHLLFGRVRWKHSAAIVLVYLLASGPDFVMQTFDSVKTFLWAYVSPRPTGLIAWPDVLQTVGEAQYRGLKVNIERLYGFLPIVIAGFAGTAYLCLRHFKKMIPIAPVLLLGVWSLFGPNRFSMYMAPFIGIGAGVIIELLVRYAAPKLRLKRQVTPLASAAVMFLLFFSTSGYTGYSKVPDPILSAPTTRALLEIKETVPKHSAMFTPYWEFGYPLMEIGDFATYHDGGLQGGIRTTLASIASMSSNQKDLVSLLSYVEDNGFVQLSSVISKEKLTADQMLDLVFHYPGEFRGENVYVLYLEKMIWKIYSMSKLGSWDFASRQSSPTDYVEIFCYSLVNDMMTCSDGTIDLKRGLMNDGTVDVPLRAAVFVNNGYITEEKHFRDDEGYYLQVFMKDGKVYMILVADPRLYRSNFNQQYLLGNFDRRYFEEVYNNFPVARVLKVKHAENIEIK